MVRLGWIGVALVMLGGAACDGGAEREAAKTKIEIANPYQERLLGLSVLNRSLGLRRAIQDAGKSCRRIAATAYQQPYKGQHLWIGRCAPEGDYAIFVAANGNVQVRRCADVKDLMLPPCRTDRLQEVELLKAS